MFYYVSFVVFARRSESVLLWGPEDYDLFEEYRKFKERIESKLGPEPSLLEPQSLGWVHRLEVLREFQQEYQCTGDYEAIFIEHLTQRCGFERRRSTDIRLA